MGRQIRRFVRNGAEAVAALERQHGIGAAVGVLDAVGDPVG
jgi:bacterioferritin-associated ferredoxin